MFSDDLSFALHLADRADAISLLHFTRASQRTSLKTDGSIATEADLAVEKALLSNLRLHRPDDGYLGEELGAISGNDRRWIVDGIDGSHWFAAGTVTWATLIALEVQGRIDLGVVSSPAQRTRWWAQRDSGAYVRRGDRAASRATVSNHAALPGARTLIVPAPVEMVGWRRNVADCIERESATTTMAWHHWATGVVEGRIDACVFLCGYPWDHAALTIIVEEAGGLFTDIWGGRSLASTTAVYSNGRIHTQVLDSLGRARPTMDQALTDLPAPPQSSTLHAKRLRQEITQSSDNSHPRTVDE